MSSPLFIIVLSQFFGTSLWFTPNGVSSSLLNDAVFTLAEMGYLTSAVQVGFILGTLTIAFSGYADKYRASRIFFVSSLFGAACNFLFIFSDGSFAFAFICRLLTGVALAGIYPIGMKLVVSWYPLKTGHALGWLVGMLTLGTAFPHLVQAIGGQIYWQLPIIVSSFLALIAGLLIYRLGEGEHLPIKTLTLSGEVFASFKNPAFKSSAMAYFGHCWELYAFWALVPLFLKSSLIEYQLSDAVGSLMAFLIIAIGLLGCLFAGWLSHEWGSAKTAFAMLLISGVVCLLWPLVAETHVLLILLTLFIWGFTVIADSAQYSALAAQNCSKDYVGSALALMNSIGFLMTAISISLVTYLFPLMENSVSWVMLLGPLVGILSLRKLLSA